MDSLKKRFPLYSHLLALYPAEYRQTYGDEMLQTFADMLDNAQSPADRLAIRIRAGIDLPLTAANQQMTHIGGTMLQEIPTHIKRTTYIGAALLAPFVTALSANGLDKVINNHTLLNSWLWRMPWLAIWVLYLPLAALTMSIIGLTIDLCSASRQHRTATATLRTMLRRTWPILLIGGCAFFVIGVVFGHDSVHCIMGNPVREIRNTDQTIRCLEQR